ncbi:MAG: LamG domain-containing protein, partial [Bacteroidales bacterium]|nr:LamG domain-containing protein [Bacteroidales bacterium]
MKKNYLFKTIGFIFLTIIFTEISSFGQTGNVYTISLDGNESFYVNDDASNNLDLPGSYTFECWFNLDTYSQYDRIFDRRYVFAMSIMAANGTGDFALRFTERGSSHNVLRTLETDAAYDMDLDTWYHVAVTFDDATNDAKLYINGNLADSDNNSNWSLTSSSTALNIGGLYNSGYSNQIDAIIDEVRVSDIARSISDIQTSFSREEYDASDANSVLVMHLNNTTVPPTYVSGTGLTGGTGDDPDLSSADYVTATDKLLIPDYQSKATGNWSATGTWQYYNGSTSLWADATITPNQYADDIAILNTHTVTIDANVTIDQVAINSGGQVTISSGVSATLNNGIGIDLDVSGILKKSGSLTLSGGPDIVIQSGGKYQHDTDASVSTATWNSGSTCEIIGVGSGTTFLELGNVGQSFHHFSWNSSSQARSIGLQGLTTIDGDFTFQNSNGNDVRLVTSATDKTLSIDGDVSISGGILELTNASGHCYFVCNEGDFSQTGGTISAPGTGTGYLRFGPLSGSGYSGTFTHSGGTFTPEDIQINPPYSLTLASNMNIGTAPFTVKGVFTVPSSYTFTIPSGGLTTLSGDMTVNGTLTNSEGNAGLVIKANGSLIEGDGVSATVEQHISAEAWHLVSMPVTSAQAGVYTGLYLYEWDEPNGVFNQINSTGYGLTVARGYYAWSESSIPSPTDVEFTGILNTGNQSPSLTFTSGSPYDPDGWNLAGNPYPSGLKWDNTWSQSTSLDPTVYVYDAAESGNWVHYNYTPGSTGNTLPNGEIPPTQGFYVKADNNSPAPSMTIPNNKRVHTSNNFYKGSESEDDVFEINITTIGNAYSDRLFMGINNETTNNFDSQFDAYKLMGLEEAPQLYSYDTETKFAVNLFPEFSGSKSIPLGLRVGSSTEYSFTVEGLENFNTEIEVYLEDNTSGNMIDLRENQVYTFFAEQGLDESRFVVHFNPEFVNLDPSVATNNISIYSFNKSVFVNYHL